MDRLPAEIIFLRTQLVARAEEQIVDPHGVDTSSLDRRFHDMGGENRRLGIVERAAIGAADRGTRG
jgi:hypothetical protein